MKVMKISDHITVRVREHVVKIGEPGNICILKHDEWESLKEKILSGEL